MTDTINLEDIARMQKERRKINALDLYNIRLMENGKEIEIPREKIKEFKYTGLGTIAFFTTRFWETTE